ncbi:NIPSNAP family protein [Rubrolithibacter danxiaensis]|uniref:NIPSNAP family protein n=1 Tax=Rubrolithibacter danxiaensis TaxID=3390805 RepID=UPI003BF83FB2
MKNHFKASAYFYSLLAFCCSLAAFTANAQSSGKRYFYELKIYHLANSTQQEQVEKFLEKAYLPALHRNGINKAGVFKPVEKDSLDDKIYVFIPFQSLEDFSKLDAKLQQDKKFLSDGKEYIDANYKDAPYKRIETILIKAFSEMPAPAVPALKGAKNERIYELRSYEGPTEKYYVNKVHMFNQGGEVPLFKRLGFNAVFYGEVLAGSHMPNLMYMTTFNNKAERDAKWKTFGEDPEWKKLSSMPMYQNNVSKADILFLYPTDYSDF